MSAREPSKLVYLAGSIDLVDPLDARNWRSQAAQILKMHGYGVFSPAHAFELPTQPSRDTAMSVLGINKAALELCDAILVNLAGPSYGTPIEFTDFLTTRRNRPAACFNGNQDSLYIKTWPHFSSMEAAITELVKCP